MDPRNAASASSVVRVMAVLARSTFRLAAAVHFAAVIAIAVGAYTGALPTSLPAFPHADLVGHALLIGLLAMLVDGALGWRALVERARWLHLGPALVLLVAGLEEWAQRFSPRRTSSWSDFAADVAGVLLFSWAGGLLRQNITPSDT
jgi:hypothetical protein